MRFFGFMFFSDTAQPACPLMITWPDVDNPPSWNALSIHDSADSAPRIVGINTFTSNGAQGGVVTGLAPATIAYKYGDTNSVYVATGTGADAVDVAQTGVPTYITDRGLDIVNVGYNGFVQGILGSLYLTNPLSFDTLTIDDSRDVAARTVTLSTYTTAGGPWGAVTGLAPATINDNYGGTDLGYGTSSVQIFTNTAGVTVNVQATGVQTFISTVDTGTEGGYDTVNVGDAGSLLGIIGDLYVDNPSGYTALDIDDSADTAIRDAQLTSTAPAPFPANWGTILGLSPGSFNFAWFRMYGSSVNIETNPGYVSWLVYLEAEEIFVEVIVYDNGVEIN
jgi:hypothetical protein